MKKLVKDIRPRSRRLCITALFAAITITIAMAACGVNGEDAAGLEGKWNASGGRAVQFGGNLFGRGINEEVCDLINGAYAKSN
jgi:hypothetical protein